MSEKQSEFAPQLKTRYYRGNILSISNPYVTINDPSIMFVEGLIYEGKTSINWLGNKLGFSLKNKKIHILE